MALCNAHYYATRDPLGASGDFTTAPEISQMFGEMVGACLADCAARSGSADAIYAELGPGRHPTQLYEAVLEGIVLFAILAFMFWKTKARYEPGKLVGAFILFYGLFRFAVEYIREPDNQFAGTIIEASGLHMGQWLSVPMILGGIYLIATAKGRRDRVEPVAGTESVA